MTKLLYFQQTWQEIRPKIGLNYFIFFLISLSFILFLFKLTRSRKLNLPPSPPKLPVIGNIHHLGTLPHRSLQALSEKYGPLMLLHMGHVPTLIVSSAEAAREMMKTHDIVFANRPQTTAASIFFHGCVDVGFSPYGEYWRKLRKISAQELLGPKMVQSFHHVREEEAAGLIDKIRFACHSGTSVNLSEMLISVSSNVVSRCVVGRKADKEGGNSKFGELTRTVTVQLTAFSFGDLFPYLGWMDTLTGLIPRLKATSRALDCFLDQVIEEHRSLESTDGDSCAQTGFLQALLQLQKNGNLDVQLTRDNIIAVVLDMFAGGTDTSSTMMEWAMAELVRNQTIMRKAQEEVRRIVGKKSKVEASDIEEMAYLKCILKETLRLHPSAPLLVPRETSASVELGGYDIPPKTRVLVNAFAIQRDPSFWDRPDEFLPERFENNTVDFKSQDFQFIPFGSGRRSCPGALFGVTAVESVIANLLYWFDWRLPDGASEEELDMSEVCGMTAYKKIPLLLVPSLYSP
ncbi:cytochrome P450 71A1-like [Populus alba x Populus x berolinensis]|nr:cytochrome P450 71A1-like [Populus alba x Populus x berolinensis]